MEYSNIHKELLGPQSKSDSVFARKARLLQSYYRCDVLKSDFGYGPYTTSKSEYGNMLINGEKTGENFISSEIFEYASFRVRNKKKFETIDEYRLFNNMLSSQPMCFNLFYPIRELFEKDFATASRLLALSFPHLNIKRALSIELEYLPSPIDHYLNDRTAFDALVTYVDHSGKRNLLAIETKYVEKLGKNISSDLSTQIEFAKESKIFSSEGMAGVRMGLPQLGRNFLLAQKVKEVDRFDEAYAVVISPKENNSSMKEIEDFKKLLNDEYQKHLFFLSLEDFTEKIEKNCTGNLKSWIHKFKTRYLGFELIKQYL